MRNKDEARRKVRARRAAKAVQALDHEQAEETFRTIGAAYLRKHPEKREKRQ
jgi:hypothetical protein